MLRLLDQFADKIPADLLAALKSDATPEVRREASEKNGDANQVERDVSAVTED